MNSLPDFRNFRIVAAVLFVRFLKACRDDNFEYHKGSSRLFSRSFDPRNSQPPYAPFIVFRNGKRRQPNSPSMN